MSRPILCPAVAYRATRDNPEELCENEVENHGDLCSRHEADDRDEYDRERHEEDARDDERYDR